MSRQSSMEISGVEEQLPRNHGLPRVNQSLESVRLGPTAQNTPGGFFDLVPDGATRTRRPTKRLLPAVPTETVGGDRRTYVEAPVQERMGPNMDFVVEILFPSSPLQVSEEPQQPIPEPPIPQVAQAQAENRLEGNQGYEANHTNQGNPLPRFDRLARFRLRAFQARPLVEHQGNANASHRQAHRCPVCKDEEDYSYETAGAILENDVTDKIPCCICLEVEDTVYFPCGKRRKLSEQERGRNEEDRLHAQCATCFKRMRELANN